MRHTRLYAPRAGEVVPNPLCTSQVWCFGPKHGVGHHVKCNPPGSKAAHTPPAAVPYPPTHVPTYPHAHLPACTQKKLTQCWPQCIAARDASRHGSLRLASMKRCPHMSPQIPSPFSRPHPESATRSPRPAPGSAAPPWCLQPPVHGRRRERHRVAHHHGTTPYRSPANKAAARR